MRRTTRTLLTPLAAFVLAIGAVAGGAEPAPTGTAFRASKILLLPFEGEQVLLETDLVRCRSEGG